MTTQDIFDSKLNAKKLQNKGNESYKNKVVLLKEHIENYSPDLYDCTYAGRITKKDIYLTMSMIKGVGDFGSVLYLRNLYYSIIRNVHDNYGWKTAPVPKFYLCRRNESRYSTGKFLNRQKYALLENIFWQTVDDIKNLTSAQRATQLIVSAVLFGGVLEKSLLVSLSNYSLNKINSIYEYVWFNLPANKSKSVEGTIQRWFAEPISTQLLIRYRADSLKRNSKLSKVSLFVDNEVFDDFSLWKNILELLKQYNCYGQKLPNNLSNFISWAQSDYNSIFPPYLVDIACGVSPSYSMSNEAMNRSIYGIATVHNNEFNIDGDINRNEIKSNKINANYNINLGSGSELDNFRTIRKSIISGEHNSHYECKYNLSEATKHICDYYVHLLNGTAPGRIKHKGRSIETYFGFSEEFIAFSHGKNIVSMDIENIETLYEDIFEKQNTIRRQSRCGKFIKHFHNYLVREYGVEKIIFDELDGFVSEKHSVNSNVISPKHYSDVLSVLWPSYLFDDRLNCIRYLITVLGYRLNMRRQEIRRLRICDVRVLKTQFFVRVVNTENGVTKSVSGWRWTPVHDLLDDKELSFLRIWHQLRVNEASSERALIFTEKSSDLCMISRYKTFEMILKVIRSITGDPNIRFHSLRHSFATWLLISIEANRLPNILDERFDVFSKDNGLKPANFKTLIDGKKPTKKILYQLALIMGHSSPSMTLLHYVHSCDWILYHWCCKRIPRLSVDKIAPLLGVNKREVNKILKEHNLLDQNKTADLVECLTSYDGWKLKPEWNDL
ncbi:MAG: tyrosine-type recombinase/integrase [Woeseiaceae bacterium]